MKIKCIKAISVFISAGNCSELYMYGYEFCKNGPCLSSDLFIALYKEFFQKIPIKIGENRYTYVQHQH